MTCHHSYQFFLFESFLLYLTQEVISMADNAGQIADGICFPKMMYPSLESFYKKRR